MKYRLLCLIICLAGCRGKLTDEQRKQMKEGMEAHEIKRVTDAQLTEAAFAYGRKLSTLLQERDRYLVDQSFIDSLENAFRVEIVRLQSDNIAMRPVERQILEAYLTSGETSDLNDNVQKEGKDTLLYTVPRSVDRPDGSTQFNFALGIRMPVKEVILSIKD